MQSNQKGVIAALCCLAALASVPAHAQTYPSKPFRFIVGFPVGTLPDTFARAIGSHLSQRLGQPAIIENRAGASQIIALEAAAKSPPDGHTLVYGTQSGMVFTTATKKNLPYDPLKDFAAIGLLFQTPLYLVVHPSVPAKNVQEFIAYVKAHPGKLSFGSVGQGSSQHLAMELFKTRTGLDMVHVPYKGSPAAAVDLLSAQIQAMFEGPTTSRPHILSGKIRALASSGAQRTRAFPQIPTVIESGVPGYQMEPWFGIQTMASVPRTIIDRLNQEVNQWLRLPGTEETLGDRFSLEFTPSTPEQMTERIRREIPLFVKLMRAAGIEPE